MNNKTLLCTLLIGTYFLIGCGSGGGGDDSVAPPPSTVVLTTYYDTPTNTMIFETGPVLTDAAGQPTTTKHGAWQTYFPAADGSGMQWQRIFVNGTWDNQQNWTEYNADSSIRDTMSDGLN
jgi:hypothetical protein